jgi:hypothetical protein
MISPHTRAHVCGAHNRSGIIVRYYCPLGPMSDPLRIALEPTGNSRGRLRTMLTVNDRLGVGMVFGRFWCFIFGYMVIYFQEFAVFTIVSE